MLKTQVLGNIGGDAEIRNVNNDSSVISFSVAHSEKWKDAQGNQQERTTWVKCSKWVKAGQTTLAQYLKKGTKVYVEGVPSASAWKNPNDGEAYSSLDLRVLFLELAGGAQTNQATPAQAASLEQSRAKAQADYNAKVAPAAPAVPTMAPLADDDDDLPF